MFKAVTKSLKIPKQIKGEIKIDSTEDMSRPIVPTKPLTGGQSQNWKVKSTRGDTTVPAASSSMPVGGAGSSATASSTSSRGSAENSLMDDLRKALEIFKKKIGVTETLKARMDTIFKKLLEGIRQGSSKDVSDALISLEAISNAHHDANLIHLVKEMKEEQCLKAQTSGINSRVAIEKKLNESVNVWLKTLKNDIESGSCTLLLKEDTPIELKMTRDLLQEITKCLKDNHLRQTRENNSLIEEIENLNKDIAMLTSSKPSTWKDVDMHSQRINILGQKLKQLKDQPKRSANEERKKFESLSSKLADQENKIQVIWSQLEQRSMRTEDHLSMLHDIDKYLQVNKRSLKNSSEERKKFETLADQEKKIQDIWAQFFEDEEQTPTPRAVDHLAMLNDIDKYLKEKKSSIGRLQANEQLVHEQIEQFQKEIEASDTDRKLQDIKETGKEIELVRKVIQIRKHVRGKVENRPFRIKVNETNSQRTQEQVVGIWNLLFDKESNDPENDVSRKDVNALLDSIHEELNRLEKTVFHVEECCYNMYQSLFGTKLPHQEMKTSKSTLLKTAKVLTECKDEAESIEKWFTQLKFALGVEIEGRLSSQCERMKSTMERLFVARAPVVNNLLKMYHHTMQQKYIPSRTLTTETGRSQTEAWDDLNGTADEVIVVVVDICDQISTKYESLQNVLTKCQHEKAELLTRLSKIAGANLTNNNPNIADLSDPYRPTKLGEMYSELYDNVWTDAFEALDKSGKGNKDKEQTNIQLLLEILSESYKTCEDVSMRQQQAIIAALTDPIGQETSPKDKSSKKAQSSALQSKAVTELRKLSADTFVQQVQHFFEENCLKEKGSKKKRSIWVDNEPVKKYTMKCIELCWLMHIQAPPVHIDLTGQPNDKFDTNKFKQYTKSGNKIHFVVWPPLLLHDEGPLLSKGVAQGK